ncbi:hypothetical protein DN402_08325 [Streptomyces sp. SW4]|nr:hypothetical protein DN402_08325 [Streptomyces sp. SW4]
MWKVEFADGGFVLDRVTGLGKVKPGAELRPGLGFTHFGARTVHGAHVWMYVEHGSFVREFGNCEYGSMPVHLHGDPSGERVDVTHAAVVCHFDDTIEVGDSYDFSPGRSGPTRTRAPGRRTSRWAPAPRTGGTT